MARYFKFHSAEELERGAAALGLAIEARSDLSPLSQPAMVADRLVGNRLAFQPMEGCDGEPDGSPGDLTVRRFRRFGAGGAKLLWGEAIAILPEARANPRQLVLHPKNLDSFKRLVEWTRADHRARTGSDDDFLIGFQLTHSGRYSFSHPVRVRACSLRDAGRSLPMLSDDDLRRIADQYLVVAQLAQRAGADFVDIKQCHGYLLNELLAARTRPGIFGGPLENRARFAIDLIQRIRQQAPSLIVATRLNLYDGIPHEKVDGKPGRARRFVADERGFGVDPNDPAREDLAEPLETIALFQRAGLSLLNVTLGCPYTAPHYLRPAEFPPIDGYDAPEHPLVGVARHLRVTEAAQRRFTELPIVGSGYSYLQDYLYQVGAAQVARGAATFVGVGRASLADPSAPWDALTNGAIDRKRICRTFSYCTNLMRSKDHPLGQFPAGCPPFDKEVYHPLWEEAKAKRAT